MQRIVIQPLIDFIQNTPTLPRYEEGGYSPLGRSPVVDAVLDDPFFMPTFARKISNFADNNSLVSSLSYELMNASGIPTEKNLRLFEISDPTPVDFETNFGPSLGSHLYQFWMHFLYIKREVEKVINILSDNEKVWLKSYYPLFFFKNVTDDSNYDFFTSDNPLPFKFYILAAKVDFAKLSECAIELSLIVDGLDQLQDELSSCTLKEDFIFKGEGSSIRISKKSHSELNDNDDFFIGLGTNNVVNSHAGGTEGIRPVALHIDINGNNFYKGTNFTQGSGFLGIGLLACYKGNNTFIAQKYSQGSGFFGVGYFINYGPGNRFELAFGGQSFAAFGSSLLINHQGQNTFIAHDGMAQGASSTLGVAFLLQKGGGNTFTSGKLGSADTRQSGMGQGGTSGWRNFPWINRPCLYGGLSFLYSSGDNNSFSTPWLGQGSAYFLGAGFFVNKGSHNTFLADFDVQGQGLHLAAGLLLNEGSYNTFTGGWGSLASAGDRSIGMLLSEGNNNTFTGTDQSMGTARKPKAIGVFIGKGNENAFQFGKYSCTDILLPSAPLKWPRAIFVELSPTESMEDLFKIFTSDKELHSKTAYRPLILPKLDHIQVLAEQILEASYDKRRQIYESLDLIRFENPKIHFNLGYLLKNPSILKEDQFNYAMLWALRNKELVDLTGIRQSLKKDLLRSEYVRKMAVNLLGIFWDKKNIPYLEKAMESDDLDEIRYYAALALALHANEDTISLLQKGIGSEKEVVRYAIAKGLQENDLPDALNLIQPLLYDDSMYVKRAASLTAISLKDKNGISIYLNSLYTKTLDTDDNYGNNVYKNLVPYIGVDFGVDQKKWISWWAENEPTFHFPF